MLRFSKGWARWDANLVTQTESTVICILKMRCLVASRFPQHPACDSCCNHPTAERTQRLLEAPCLGPPLRPCSCLTLLCVRFQSLDLKKIDVEILFETSRDHVLIQDLSRLSIRISGISSRKAAARRRSEGLNTPL